MLIVLREARDIAQVGDVLCVQWHCGVVALSIIQHKKHFGESRWRVQNSNSVTEKTSESFWWKCCVLRLLMNENCTVHFCIVSNVICLIQSWGRQDRETIFHTFFFCWDMEISYCFMPYFKALIIWCYDPGRKESHFYSLPFRQAEDNIY